MTKRTVFLFLLYDMTISRNLVACFLPDLGENPDSHVNGSIVPNVGTE